jgi:hypothetical protein
MRRPVKFLPLLIPLLVAAALVVVFLRTMGHDAPRLAASNSVPTQGLVVQIGQRANVCQHILAPRGAASVQFFVAPLGAKSPPLSMRLDNGGRTLATSHIAPGWSGGTIRFPFPALTETYTDARICVRNDGRALLRFVGLSNPPSTSTQVNGRPESAVISAEFFRQGEGDAWSLLPTIAQHAGVLKGSLAGGWSFWVAVAFVLIAGVGAIALSLRGYPR